MFRRFEYKTDIMITKLSHTTIFVTDQDKAYEFYVNKLGFKVHTDVKMENGYRWLTITAPEQSDTQIILMPTVNNSMMDEESKAAFKTLQDRGILGAGVMQTPNCMATYEELKAKGVQFKSEPKEQFYGIEALVLDGCGNWFSMTEPKEI